MRHFFTSVALLLISFGATAFAQNQPHSEADRIVGMYYVAYEGEESKVKFTKEEDGTYTFTMPESPVTVSAVFGPMFQDVAESDWFYAAVQYVYEQGIMSGVEEGKRQRLPQSLTYSYSMKRSSCRF